MSHPSFNQLFLEKLDDPFSRAKIEEQLREFMNHKLADWGLPYRMWTRGSVSIRTTSTTVTVHMGLVHSDSANFLFAHEVPIDWLRDPASPPVGHRLEDALKKELGYKPPRPAEPKKVPGPYSGT